MVREFPTENMGNTWGRWLENVGNTFFFLYPLGELKSNLTLQYVSNVAKKPCEAFLM